MIDFSKTTALFGGSFDPIHLGHIHVAKNVLRLLPEMQQLFFVPAFQSPGKPPMAPPNLRSAWLEMAVVPGGFGLWNIEIERKGTSYTVDTLEEAHRCGARRENLYWIIGSDAYYSFPNWKNPERIRELARLIVVNRTAVSPSPQNEEDILLSIEPHPASSTLVREGLAALSPKTDYLPPAVREDMERLFLRGYNPYAKKRE